MSGVSLPHAASSLQLIPAINPVSPPFLGRYQELGLSNLRSFMKNVDQQTLDKLCREATASPRRRAHLNLHEDLEEDVQRLLIAMQPDTYIRPHRHPEPYKKETLIILQGRCACMTFHNDGSVDQSTILDPAKGTYLCEFPDQQGSAPRIVRNWLDGF